MSETEFAGRVCLVTGAGSGIGRATATRFAGRGATVIVSDIDMAAAEVVADDIAGTGGKAEPIVLDVSSDAAWREAIDHVMSRHKALHVLVNNAGISQSRPILDASFDDWRRVMAVNLDGVFLGTKCAMEVMGIGGSIVNVASVAGIKPFGGASAYCASKAAIRMFTKAVAIECADASNGIRVNLVTPGGVRTPIWEKEPFFQMMMAECGSKEAAFDKMAGGKASTAFFEAAEVAESIVYLASDDAAHLTGTEIVLDRGHS